MRILRGRKVLITSIVAVMMLFAVGILAFGGLTTTAYAQGDETIRDGYTMEDVQELLNENDALSSTGTWDLQIYSQNGIMNTIEVPEEEEESSTQSLIQPMAAPSFTTQTLIDSGRADSQSIVVMIMGDGFTSTQQATFITAATNIANDLVGQYPMSLFNDYFNIYAIEVISSESGVSNDINGFNWWTNNPSNVNNYFGSRFYFDAHIFNPTGTERSLYISKESKVKALERTNTVMSMVVCNSTRWGGAAGKYAVSSLASGYENIAAHEFGHAFGDLEDEYWYSGEKFRTSEAANKSKSTTKWSQWIDSTSTGIYRIGTHRFSSTTSDTAYNWYKPHTSCKMQFSTSAFCAVCSAELAQKMAAKTTAAFTTTDLANNDIRIEKMNLAYQGHFTIPNKWNGRFVTEIGTSAFVSRNGVSQVTIPTTVTSIGTSAFSGLTNLTQVNFGTSPTLQTIGNSAFANQTQLSQISIPASVTQIGFEAFNPLTLLTSFGGNRADIDLVVAEGTKDTYIANGWTGFNVVELSSVGPLTVTSGQLRGEIEIPATFNNRTITSIGDNGFANQTEITGIILPISVSSISNSAFANCSNLEYVFYLSLTGLASTPNHLTSYDNHYYTQRSLDISLQPNTTYTLSFDYSNLTANTNISNVFTPCHLPLTLLLVFGLSKRQCYQK